LFLLHTGNIPLVLDCSYYHFVTDPKTLQPEKHFTNDDRNKCSLGRGPVYYVKLINCMIVALVWRSVRLCVPDWQSW